MELQDKLYAQTNTVVGGYLIDTNGPGSYEHFGVPEIAHRLTPLETQDYTAITGSTRCTQIRRKRTTSAAPAITSILPSVPDTTGNVHQDTYTFLQNYMNGVYQNYLSCKPLPPSGQALRSKNFPYRQFASRNCAFIIDPECLERLNRATQTPPRYVSPQQWPLITQATFKVKGFKSFSPNTRKRILEGLKTVELRTASSFRSH